MSSSETSQASSSRRPLEAWIAILVMGSLWGLSEVVLGAALRTAGIPYRSAMLTAVGLGIVGIAAGTLARKRFTTLAAIPLVAVACKQLVVPILGISPLCKANSCLAVALEGIAIAAAVRLVDRRLDRSALARAGAGGAAALAASLGFYVAGMHVAPCNYLLSFNRPGGLLAFMAAEGLIWAGFSALLFPVGYAAGARLRNTLPEVRALRPVLYYSTSAALVAVSWIGSSLAIAAGA
jgi:hypothetical protein